MGSVIYSNCCCFNASAYDNYKLYDHIQDVVDFYLAGHPDSLICIVGDFNPNSTNMPSNRFRQLCGLTQIVNERFRHPRLVLNKQTKNYVSIQEIA